MPASVVLSAIYGSTFMAAAALGAVGYAVATFAINLVATAVISSIIAKRAAKGASDQAKSIKQIGTRTQVPPSTDNKIGVVYGSAFMKPIIIDAKISTDQKKMWYVMVFSEAMDSDSIGTFSFGDIYWGDKKLNFDGTDQTKVVSWTGSDGTTEDQPNGLINVYLYRDGSSVPVNTTQTAIQVLQDSEIAEANRWDSTKLMSKLVFAVVKIQYDQEKGITSIAEITAQINNTLSKPGSVIKDYLTNTRYGAGLSLSKINTTKLAELDAYSDETISYTPSGGGAAQTMPRYRINGPVDTTQNFLANLVDMADAADSWVQWNEAVGQWSVVINRSYLDTDPTSAGVRQVNSNNIVGGVDLTPIDLNETYNSVEIQFPNTKIKDQPGYHYIDISEFPNIVRNANEPDNRLSVALPYTNNIVQAQYIAGRRLLQSREDLTINFTMDYSGIQIDAGDVIGIHHERYGWGSYNELVSQPYGKLFRVTQVQESKAADGSLYARIFASEYNDNVYDDNNIDLADFTPSLNTGISDPTVITTPATPTITDINNVGNIPNFTVNVVIPSTGTTVGMEFWYGTEASLDSGTYRLYDLTLPVGQTSFTKGSTLSVRFTGLDTDTYYIRCRAVGARLKSSFSDYASVGWEPTFISGVVGQDISVNFAPPSLAVPRLGPNLVPQYTDVRLKAYGQVGGAQLSYVDALQDSDPAFTSSTWRIASNASNGYTTEGVVQLSNVGFTLTEITPTLDGGVIFPPPFAMNSQTAVVTIPVRFKDAAGNIFQSTPASAQLFFQDQGVQGPPGADGVNPGFIDLSSSAGGFFETLADVFSPESITVTATAQNISNPIPLWTVTGADYTTITTTGTNTFTNNTVVITPQSEASVITVRVDIGLYNKTATFPVSRQGPQGIPGEFAGRGFIPLAYIPINVDPTLATQTQLTNAWTTATGYTPIANDGGTFWYITATTTSTNLTFNGSIWIPAQLQLAGNLIAAGSITADQLNGNSVFTNRLASTNQASNFGVNTGPGYWLDGQGGDAYFGGNVKIGENLNVEGLITAGTLIARVVDTDVIVPGAVSEGQRVFYETTRQISAYDPLNETVPPTSAWTTGTRGLVFPTGVSIVPKVDARDGGRIYIEFSTTLYNNRGNNKNLVELWRLGNVITNIRFKRVQLMMDNIGYVSQSGLFFGTPNPRDQDHFLRLHSREFGTGRNDYIEGNMVSKDFDYNHTYTWRQEDTGYYNESATPWHSTSTAISHYWLFGDGGRYAHIATTASDYTAYQSSQTLPTPEYGQLKIVNPVSTGTITTTDLVQGITAFSRMNYFITKINEVSNYTALSFPAYKSNFELFMGDENGDIYATRPHLLPKVIKETNLSTGTTRPKINAFATTELSAANAGYGTPGSIPVIDRIKVVIGVGDNGRIVKSQRLPLTRQETDWVKTSSSSTYEYYAGKYSWTESTFGNYNLNDISSDFYNGDLFYLTGPNSTSVYGPTNGWITGRTVIAVGDFGTILVSNNFGQTFTKVDSGTLENLRSVTCTFPRVFNTVTNMYGVPGYPVNNRWWATGDNGVILQSLDNGQTWNSAASIPSEEIEGGFYTPNVYDVFQPLVTYNDPGATDETRAFVRVYPLWSADDRVVSIGTGSSVANIDLEDIITNTSTTAIVVSTATSALIWKRLWYLGSNSSPFVNTVAPVGSRLNEPSATVGVVINDNNYIADSANGLTYQYHLVVGNMDGITGSTATFATNSFLSVTEFKR